MTSVTTRDRGWCVPCYLQGIGRLCDGYAIVYSTGKTVIAVPPLDANMAADVRKAAQAHIERHGTGDTGQHPHHTRRMP